MNTSLVTGAAGFVGSHLVERLLAQGETVVGVDSFDDYYSSDRKRANLRKALENPRFRLLEADLAELDVQHLEGIARVFHLAGQPGVRGSWGSGFSRYIRNNVVATQHLLELCSKRDIAKIVYASSSSVYGNAPMPQREDGPANPHSPYGVTKLAAEHLCSLYARNDGLPAVSVRFFTVYGPRQRPDMAFDRFLRAIRAGKPVSVFGDGLQSRDFTYVDDIVDGMLLAADRGRDGEAYNLGGGTRIALIDAIHAMQRATGRVVQVEFGGPERGDVAQTSASTAKAQSELGYSPCVGIDDGIERHAAALGMRRRTYASAAFRRTPRVAIYSHDTYGLGHLRRNLAIADHILHYGPAVRVLLMTGSPVIDEWVLPEGLEVQPLPPVVKIGADRYAARDGAVDFDTVKSARVQAMFESLQRFKPDVVLVDHAPSGMKGELLPVFDMLRREFPATRLVLGLRDIVDDPATVRRTWSAENVYPLIERTYDRVLVYGSPEIFSPVEAYAFPAAINRKTRYCGYVSQSGLRARGDRAVHTPLRILVSAGGGGDGFPLLRDALCALQLLPPDAVRVTLLAGPLMAAAEYDALSNMAASIPEARLVRSTSEPVRFLADADLAITMGGYNTMAELLATRTPALVVPRTSPRQEQKLRADLLSARGLIWTVQQSSVERAAEYIRGAIAGARPARIDRHAVDLNGAQNAAAHLYEIAVAGSIAVENV